MRFLALAVAGWVVAGCATAPKEPEAPVHKGPDVDVEVLAMQSRPLRVMNAPTPVVNPKEAEEEKPRPRRKRRKPKPAVKPKADLPPTERFVPKASVVEEPPIDIPAEGDWPAALSKEFQRREEDRKRRGGGEEE